MFVTSLGPRECEVVLGQQALQAQEDFSHYLRSRMLGASEAPKETRGHLRMMQARAVVDFLNFLICRPLRGLGFHGAFKASQIRQRREARS